MSVAVGGVGRHHVHGRKHTIRGKMHSIRVVVVALLSLPASAQDAKELQPADQMHSAEPQYTIASSTSSEDKPPWLWYEYGERAFEYGELGEALHFYTMALEQRSVFPEAIARLADIYAAQAEPELALSVYQQALDRAGALVVADDEHAIRYRVARLQRLIPEYHGMESTLLKIASEEKEFSATQFSRLRQAMVDAFATDGLDRTLQLYRLDTPVAVEAHATLGWFYHRSGRDARSIPHSLFAVINIISEVARELRSRDPEHQLAPLITLLNNPNGFSPSATQLVLDYMEAARLHRALYYLAISSRESGLADRGTELLRALAASESAGEYRELARRQLSSPWTEPLLELPPPPESLPPASAL